MSDYEMIDPDRAAEFTPASTCRKHWTCALHDIRGHNVIVLRALGSQRVLQPL